MSSAALVAVRLAICPGLALAHQSAAATALSSAATIDGIAVHSTASGTATRTVILVHGWTCDERTWQSQVPELSKDYRVITVDLPGHGQSGSPKDGKMSMDLFARAVEAVRVQHDANRVVLVGHSMGAAVIMQYARLYPEHAAALVIVDGSVSMPTDAWKDQMLAWAKQYGESPKVREQSVQAMSTANTSDEVRKQVLAMVLAVPAATPLAAIKAFMDPAIWKEDVFPQPVLAVISAMGLADEPPLDLPHLKPRFPKIEYHAMPDAGHFLMLERPTEFNRLLKSFLDKLDY